MEVENIKPDDILNKNIKHILDKIEDLNKIMTGLADDTSLMNEFLIIQFNHQKADFLKELCNILIASNLPATNYLDYLLDTISLLDKYNPEIHKPAQLNKPLKKQFKRMNTLLHSD